MMPRDDRSMLLFARLAVLSHERRQLPGRDRFLVLTGIAATRAGWADVADRCRTLVIDRSRRHILSRYRTMAEALRDEEFVPFAQQMERFCPAERAEHLLAQAGLTLPGAEDARSAGELALAWLSFDAGDSDGS
jgi:hypothetical protein